MLSHDAERAAQALHAIRDVFESTALEARAHAEVDVQQLYTGYELTESNAIVGIARRAPAPPRDLSRLELQIIRFVVEGRTNREIASEVHLSQNTVKFHMRQIFQKTGTSNRTELAHQVAKEGWL